MAKSNAGLAGSGGFSVGPGGGKAASSPALLSLLSLAVRGGSGDSLPNQGGDLETCLGHARFLVVREEELRASWERPRLGCCLPGPGEKPQAVS